MSLPSIPNTYRFFVDPAALSGETVQIDDPDLSHQLGRVLRLKPDERILLLDGVGSACVVRVTQIDRHGVSGVVEQRRAAGGEPPVHLTLYLALLRPERFEWAIQKAVELGVAAVVPVQCARSLPGDRADAKKLQRWRRIVREAAEQSCRGRLPLLHEAQSFEAACSHMIETDLALFLWEGSAPSVRTTLRDSLRASPQRCAIFSGPEGGFTPDELTAAKHRGIMPVSLGPRILRAETAPLAALAALLYEFEA